METGGTLLGETFSFAICLLHAGLCFTLSCFISVFVVGHRNCEICLCTVTWMGQRRLCFVFRFSFVFVCFVVAFLLLSVLSSCRLLSFVSFFLSSLFCFYLIAKSLDGSSASVCCCCCCFLVSFLSAVFLSLFLSFFSLLFSLYHHTISSSFVLPRQFSLHSNATVCTSVSTSTCYRGHLFLMGMGFGWLS